MHRYLVTAFAALLLAACASSPAPVFTSDLEGDAKPWPNEQFDAGADKFTFAIITDLNGGEREGVFQVAVEQLNLLRPEFIISVGDLIDGISDTDEGLQKEWDWFDERAYMAKAPFFHVGGNHDLTSEQMRTAWAKRYGPFYYHFTYKDVLFIALDTEDYTPARRREIHEAREAAIRVLDGPNPEAARDMDYFKMAERITGHVSDEQAAYVEQVLAEHPDVRWTFLFMHKPVWKREDANPFNRIEEALTERPYTLFNGHFHSYSHTDRKGRDYMILGTTGGSQNPEDPNSFDHVSLVTVDDGAPAIATLRMDGILDKQATIPGASDDMCFDASRCRQSPSD